MKVLFSSWNDEVIDNRGKPPEEWQDAPNIKLPTEFDKDNTITSFIGWNGIILLEEPKSIVAMCHEYMKSVQNESCGRCFPCRVGTAVLERHLKRLVSGDGTEEDISSLETLSRQITETSKCSIGETGPVSIIHALEYFRKDFINSINGGCPIKDDARYESKQTAPCYDACPTGMDIPTYIERIKEGDPLGSIETIRGASPLASQLGRSCFHPCENSCRRENVERAISICKLKRFAWDYENQHVVDLPTNPNKHTREEKVAIVGAGPAGLSAAYYLALYGYHVTIFEALSVPGGMVWVGIPAYRVPKDTIISEEEFIKSLGVEIKYNTRLGKDITIEQLKEEGYKAVFLAYGAHLSKKMLVEGEDNDYDGFLKGIDFLREFVLTGESSVKGKRVLVVGGGNVAMDCARSPIRMGAKEVTIVYRRTKKELPADPVEVHDSDLEGVKYHFLIAPKRIVAENNKVIGLECLKMELGEPDDSGRRRPVPVEGSEFVIPGDVIIQAIGQDCDLAPIGEFKGLNYAKWGSIVADPDTMQTDADWIFTGGDLYNGALTVVDSCGNARRAAKSIDQFLRGEKPSLSSDEKMDKVMKKLGVYNKNENVKRKGGWERVPMPEVDIGERVSTFVEVQEGFTPEMARGEASRCMRCYYVGMVSLKSKY